MIKANILLSATATLPFSEIEVEQHLNRRCLITTMNFSEMKGSKTVTLLSN